MSRAFVREQDETGLEPLPDPKSSGHPNYVTPRGLAQIEARLAALEDALREEHEESRAARIRRDLRYWAARRATAQVIEAGDERSDEIAFGSRVTLRRQGRAPEIIEIVGEDEADPTAGRLSFAAPLAAALMGARPGETVEVGTRRTPIDVTVLAVDNSPLRH